MVPACRVVVRNQPGFSLDSVGRGGAVQPQLQDCHLPSHIQGLCISQTCHRAHTEVEHDLGTWPRETIPRQGGHWLIP